MKASIYVLKDDKILVNSETSPLKGLRLPYLTKCGVPVFVLDTEEPDHEYMGMSETLIDAPPGMIGIGDRADILYVVDAEGNVQPIPYHVMSARDYERSRHFTQSLRAEPK